MGLSYLLATLLSGFNPEPLVGTWSLPLAENKTAEFTMNFWGNGEADGLVSIPNPDTGRVTSKGQWVGNWEVSQRKTGSMVLTLQGLNTISETFGNFGGSVKQRLVCDIKSISESRFICRSKTDTLVFYRLGKP